MKDFLSKPKLVDHLQMELEIQKKDFVNKLKENVDEGSTNIFSDAFDIFSSSKNEYKGEVNYNGFKLKRRRKFFDMNMAVAKGTYNQKDTLLIINIEVNGFNGMMIPFYIFCLIFYTIFVIGFLSVDKIGRNAPGLAIPFLIVHAAFMMGIPYFIMRTSTRRLKYELEREFYYLTK